MILQRVEGTDLMFNDYNFTKLYELETTLTLNKLNRFLENLRGVEYKKSMVFEEGVKVIDEMEYFKSLSENKDFLEYVKRVNVDAYCELQIMKKVGLLDEFEFLNVGYMQMLVWDFIHNIDVTKEVHCAIASSMQSPEFYNIFYDKEEVCFYVVDNIREITNEEVSEILMKVIESDEEFDWEVEDDG